METYTRSLTTGANAKIILKVDTRTGDTWLLESGTVKKEDTGELVPFIGWIPVAADLKTDLDGKLFKQEKK